MFKGRQEIFGKIQTATKSFLLVEQKKPGLQGEGPMLFGPSITWTASPMGINGLSTTSLTAVSLSI